MGQRGSGRRARQAWSVADRPFYRLRRLRSGRGVGHERCVRTGRGPGRHSRDPRRLRRQLEQRQLELAALQGDLRILWRSERLLSRFEAPEPAASGREARALEARWP